MINKILSGIMALGISLSVLLSVVPVSATTWETPASRYQMTGDNFPRSIEALNSSQLLVDYQDDLTDYYYFEVLNVENGVVTSAGSPVFFVEMVQAEENIIILDSTRFAVIYSQANESSECELKAFVATVSGTNITYGTEYILSTSSADDLCSYHSAALIDTNKFAVIWQWGQGGTSSQYLVVATVSGSVITGGTPVTWGDADTSQYYHVAKLDTNKAIFCYKHWDGESDPAAGYCATFTVSGTTPTIGAAYKFGFGIPSTDILYTSIENIEQLATDKVILMSFIYPVEGEPYRQLSVATVLGAVITYHNNYNLGAGSGNFISGGCALVNNSTVICYGDEIVPEPISKSTISGNVISIGAINDYDSTGLDDYALMDACAIGNYYFVLVLDFNVETEIRNIKIDTFGESPPTTTTTTTTTTSAPPTTSEETPGATSPSEIITRFINFTFNPLYIVGVIGVVLGLWLDKNHGFFFKAAILLGVGLLVAAVIAAII
jgi:hypothetical protein